MGISFWLIKYKNDLFFESLGKKGLHDGSFKSLKHFFNQILFFSGMCSHISSCLCSYLKTLSHYSMSTADGRESNSWLGCITSTRWQAIAGERRGRTWIRMILEDWYISTELLQSTGLASNSLISIKFFSVRFPEIFKVIAKHSMKYTSQIFFHYHIEL